MSASDRPDGPDADHAFLAAAGALASGVAAQLSTPLREIRDSLAAMVEALDLHFALARGPQPYPWAETKALRERIAEAYLLSRSVTRLTSELSHAVSVHRRAPETADVNQLVEQAIALARHRLGDDVDLSIDLGDVPAVRIVPGELVLLVARLLISAGDAARAASSGLAVAIRRERESGGAGGRDRVLILIGAEGAAAGSGAAGEQAQLDALARRVLEPAGGELAVRDGRHEIRLLVAK